MALTTWQEVLDDARAHLRDNAIPGGVVWQNPTLQPHAARAYRKLFDAMDFGGTNRIQRDWYTVIPARTSFVNPFALGVADFKEPLFVKERAVGTVIAITSTGGAKGALISVLAPRHGLATGADVLIGGVNSTTLPWGRWFVTVVDANTLTLNGSVSDGVAGAGGTITVSSDKFNDLDPLDTLTDRDLTDRLIDYTWEESILKFRGATTDRQLWVIYIASGTAPVIPTTVLNIDNCLNFLGVATAFYAARSNGWTNRANELQNDAFGPKGEGDASGGFLRDVISAQVLRLQRKRRNQQPFRRPRTSPTPIY